MKRMMEQAEAEVPGFDKPFFYSILPTEIISLQLHLSYHHHQASRDRCYDLGMDCNFQGRRLDHVYQGSVYHSIRMLSGV